MKKKIIYEVVFLATRKEKVKGKKTMKYHQAISFNGFKLYTVKKK